MSTKDANDFIDQLTLETLQEIKVFQLSGVNYSKSSFIRLYYKEKMIDFPENWSVFAQLSEDKPVNITKFSDQDNLLEIISVFLGCDVFSLSIKKQKFVVNFSVNSSEEEYISAKAS